ncbi:MAG: cadherin domain-containing protein, partial [Telluria sp.]
FTSGTEDTALSISYADLVSATGASDVDANTTLVFSIESVDGGTLTRNGSAVTAGVTTVGSGDTLSWTPASNTNGSALSAFTVKASDGALSSSAVTIKVDVAAVDDAPAFASLGGTTIQYTRGNGAVNLDADATLSDIELNAVSYNGSSLTLARSGGANANDVIGSSLANGANLAIGGTAVASFTNSGGTLSITFNANASQADVNGVLQSLTYANATDLGDVTIGYTFSDGVTVAQGSGGPLQANGSVALHIAPSDLVAPQVLSLERHDPTGAVTAADQLTFRVTFSEAVLNVSAGDFTVSGSTATVTSVTSAGGNAYDVVVSGGNLAGFNGVVSLGFGTQDITDTSFNALADTTPTAIDHHSYTVDNAGPTSIAGTLSVAENAANGAQVGTVTMTEPNGPVTYTLLDNAGGRFDLNAGTGVLTVADGTKLDFEAATSHNISVRVTDSLGNSSDQILAVGVTNVNEAPTLLHNVLLTGGEEDQPTTITYASLLAATAAADVDANTTLGLRIESVDGGTLTKNGVAVTPGVTVLGSGESLQWTPAANVNGKALPAFSVRAWDGALASSAAATVAVDVSAVDDAPVLGVAGGPISYTAGAAPIAIGASVGDIELDAAGYNGASFTVQRSGGGANDTFGSAYFAGGSVVVGGTAIGSVSGGSGGLSLAFNANASASSVNAVLQSLTYSNASDTGDFTLDFAFSDGTGVDQGSGGPLSATGSVALHIDSGDKTAPAVTAIERVTPAAELTDADTLTFKVSFSEAVKNVDAQVFHASGTTAAVSAVSQVGPNAYEVTLSGGDLAGYNGAVGLDVNAGKVTDTAGNKLASGEPTGSDESYLLDNAAPAAPTVDKLATPATRPVIGGDAVLGSGETMTVTVNGATFAVTPSGGHWSLDLASAKPMAGALGELVPGTYDVVATITDPLGHRSSDGTAGELTIVRPVTATASIGGMTKDSGASATDFITNDGSAGRTVSGSVSTTLGANEVVQVSFDGGKTWVQASVSGTTWSVTDGGSHGSNWTIMARVANASTGESGAAAQQDVVLDTTAPAAPGVTAQSTVDTHPVVHGTATLGNGETLAVVINGTEYKPTVSNGAWSVDLAAAPALIPGSTYDVAATVTDIAGNQSHDGTSGELVIEAANITPVPPVVAVPPTPATTPAGAGTESAPAGAAGGTPAVSATPTQTVTSAPPAATPAVVTTTPFVPPAETSVTQATQPAVVGAAPGGVVGSDQTTLVTRGPAQDQAISELQIQRAAELSDVYTSSSGFRTVVAKADEPALVLFKGMPDQYVETGTRLALVVPADAFAHTQPKEVVRLAVSQSNGQPLPGWIQFDSQTGTFKGEVPAGARGELSVKIIARDMEGREATAVFRINLGKGTNKSSMLQEGGKRGLTDQLRNVSRLARRAA